ncbi:MAG: hypothetical protein AVDCRST_MAG48-490, partial [uncultured Friedmanniella sp.]
ERAEPAPGVDAAEAAAAGGAPRRARRGAGLGRLGPQAGGGGRAGHRLPAAVRHRGGDVVHLRLAAGRQAQRGAGRGDAGGRDDRPAAGPALRRPGQRRDDRRLVQPLPALHRRGGGALRPGGRGARRHHRRPGRAPGGARHRGRRHRRPGRPVGRRGPAAPGVTAGAPRRRRHGHRRADGAVQRQRQGRPAPPRRPRAAGAGAPPLPL